MKLWLFFVLCPLAAQALDFVYQGKWFKNVEVTKFEEGFAEVHHWSPNEQYNKLPIAALPVTLRTKYDAWIEKTREERKRREEEKAQLAARSDAWKTAPERMKGVVRQVRPDGLLVECEGDITPVPPRLPKGSLSRVGGGPGIPGGADVNTPRPPVERRLPSGFYLLVGHPKEKELADGDRVSELVVKGEGVVRFPDGSTIHRYQVIAPGTLP